MVFHHSNAQSLFQALELAQKPRPVYIDLDFTLLRTSSLYFLFPYALKFFWLWIIKAQKYSWASFKDFISTRIPFHVERWPYRPILLEFITLCQEHQIPCFLATGAHHEVAVKVNQFLGCFQDVFGSTEQCHLVGKKKAELISGLHPSFTYVGDSLQDVAVWQKSAEIVVINPGSSLEKRLKAWALDWSKPMHCVQDGSVKEAG